MKPNQINSILTSYNLKDEKRTGWQLRNIEEPETVASHSWGTALQVIIHAEEEINIQKALKMAIIHDIGEAEIGDIAHRAIDKEQEINTEEKEKLESQTVKKLSKTFGEEIQELWEEYEERKTKEAKFVKDMDMIDMCLQALKYEKQGRYNPEEENENFQTYENLDEFFATTKPRLKTGTGKQLFQEIQSRYRETKGE